MKPKHAYYMFVGDNITALDKKSIRFIVETAFPTENETHFSGRVVARERNAPHEIGFTSSTWCSPIGDAKAGLFASFVRVPRSYVEEKFPMHGMSEDENS